MAYYFFIWTDEIEEHLAEHGVTRDEFEQVVCNPVSVRSSHTTDRLRAFGYSDDGRRLICIYETFDRDTIIPVTAWEP
ncbi:MAG TPA: hypothetical protein VGJ15_13725 [Pirellulales bacterium]|jgi:uncharacterized DUF497 family protein